MYLLFLCSKTSASCSRFELSKIGGKNIFLCQLQGVPRSRYTCCCCTLTACRLDVVGTSSCAQRGPDNSTHHASSCCQLHTQLQAAPCCQCQSISHLQCSPSNSAATQPVAVHCILCHTGFLVTKQTATIYLSSGEQTSAAPRMPRPAGGVDIMCLLHSTVLTTSAAQQAMHVVQLMQP